MGGGQCFLGLGKKLPFPTSDFGQKIIQPSEYVVINSQRKSIYAVSNIKTGEKLSRQNISIKGPGGGILPKYYELLLKRKAKNNISQDHPVRWDDI